MHELFKLTTALPVDPGASPFHVRGTYYTRILGHAALLPGGLAAVVGAVEDPRVGPFMAQRFSWNGWYDALPMMPISIAIAQLRGKDYEELFHERGYIAAREEIPRVFRILLSLSSPQSLWQRLPTIASAVFDFGSVEHLRSSASLATGLHRKVPLIIAPYVASTVTGFVRGALERAGAKNVKARVATVAMDGQVHGFDAVQIHYETTY